MKGKKGSERELKARKGSKRELKARKGNEREQEVWKTIERTGKACEMGKNRGTVTGNGRVLKDDQGKKWNSCKEDSSISFNNIP